MKMKRFIILLLTGMVAIIILAIAGCGNRQTASPSPAGTGTSPVASVAATPTSVPTPTPQARLVLFAPAGSDAEKVAALQDLVSGVAEQNGLAFEQVEALNQDGLTPDVRAVVALPPDPGLAELAASAPATDFLAVGIPGLAASENLTVLESMGGRADQQGFLAGYIAALVTVDWRVGVITPAGSTDGKAALNGFQNGVVFFCGLCRPAYPPYVQYPIAVEIPPGAGQAEQQAAADALIAQGVQTAYVYPGAGDDWLLNYLAQAGLYLIGGTEPPAGLEGSWIATVSEDWQASVVESLNMMLQGSKTVPVSSALVITNVNEELLSQGRQRLAEQTRQDLADGLIDTGVDPNSGERR